MWFGKSKPIYVKKTLKGKRSTARDARRRDHLYRVNTRVSDRNKSGISPEIIVGAVVILMVGAAYGLHRLSGKIRQELLTQNDDFTVQQLETFSDGRLTSKQIAEFAGVEIGEHLMSLDLSEIRNHLEEIPLVRHAEVKRQMPDTLMIEVHERKPIARVGMDPSGFSLLADVEGHIVLKIMKSDHLPLLLGVNPGGLQVGSVLENTSALNALRAIQLISERKLSHHLPVRIIAVGDPRRLDLRLKNGEQITVDTTDLAQGLDRAAASRVEASARNLRLDSLDITSGGVGSATPRQPPPSSR